MTTQYIVEEILRRNIADLELELQRQRERADKADAELKAALCIYVPVPGTLGGMMEPLSAVVQERGKP